MKTKNCILLLYVVFQAFTTTDAQIPKYYSTDNGLSNSLINHIFQDSRGFVWVSTEWGLNRFDSNKFRIYNGIASDSVSLPDNYIRLVFENSRNELFVGSINGLARYNQFLDNFDHIALVGEDGKETFPHVTSLAEMRNGDILIATSGQSIFILKNGETQANYFKALSRLLNGKFINLIYRDKLQNLWVSLETGGLYHWNSEAATIEYFDNKSGLTSSYISAIVEDNSGNVYIGTLTAGLNVYNQNSKKLTQISADKNGISVRSLFFNNDGNLLIGADGEGLKIYNPRTNQISDYQTASFMFDLANSKIHSILQDRENNLWLGLFQKGVVFLPHTSNNFKYWGIKDAYNNPLGDGCIMSIFKDADEIVWIGADNDGIYAIDKNGKPIPRNENPRNAKNYAPVPRNVLSIHSDKNGKLWVGSYTHGLAKIDKKSGKIEYIPQFADKRVYYVTTDNNGKILVGTYGSGVYILDEKTNNIVGQLESSKSENNNLYVDELFNDWINTIYADREGLIWIGHFKGLSCYNPQKNTFINFLNINNLLPQKVVFSLHEDREGLMWIGTTDGLFSFDRKTYKIERISVEDGLPNNVICAIEEDRQGNLWISTYHGLTKFNKFNRHFSHYYVGDGLQGNEFTRGASFTDENGIIYFGGINGVTYFDPALIEEQKRNLNILLTGFYIANNPVDLNKTKNAQGKLPASIWEATDFSLSYMENSFSVEFSALDYTNSERIGYQYRMGNNNSTWISPEIGNNRLNFNNLAPGRYELHVRASDNQIHSPEKVITIIVSSPWYLSRQAYIVYALLVCALLFVIYQFYRSRFRYKQELLKKEHAEAINESKLQFFINISHEIRTPMSLIISPLEKLIAENTNPVLHETYLMIHRNAKRILRLINQLMDIRKIDKGQLTLHFQEVEIVGFIEDLMLTFDYTARNKTIAFTFVHEMTELRAWVDLNNFDKIILNLLSNAFKFTPAGGVVEIALTTGRTENENDFPLDEFFTITVSDTGTGIAEQEMEKIFERFYQVASAENKAGTGVGLHLAQQLVKMHRGIIFAENREDIQGSRFVVKLPLGKRHLTQDDFAKPAEITEYKKPAEILAAPHISYEEAMDVKKLSTVKSKSGYNVAIIEDDDEIRNYLKIELSRFYRIIEFTNGKDGYNAVLKRLPDLLISDVMMPEMDGITLTRKLKQNPNTTHIPIILLTARTNIENKLEGLETGADAYMPKPFNIDEIVKTADNLLKNRARLKAKFSGAQNQDDKVAKIELKSNDEIIMQKAMKIINEHLSDSDLNVEMLASAMGMSRVHLHRKLKELTGMPAGDFIRNIRLHQAAELLKNKKLSISEVAYATGFGNLSHFSFTFREFFGKTPSEYQGGN
ncbi:MAG: helix-turn-helix domain-containing protein [Paludibacter sp.]|jgi:signal transduction histidine kinase/ligand-binding sensor domain-containing protein/DNA-binding response OmpR family regulator|nr:helix-turn-helix domain-containing protein [Paludibacter sp.]